MEQASSSGTHFYQFVTMDPSEPEQNPGMQSFGQGFSPLAMDPSEPEQNPTMPSFAHGFSPVAMGSSEQGQNPTMPSFAQGFSPVAMVPSEPEQNPTMPSFAHGFPPVAQGTQMEIGVNSANESINFVPPADPVSLFTWSLFSAMEHRY